MPDTRDCIASFMNVIARALSTNTPQGIVKSIAAFQISRLSHLDRVCYGEIVKPYGTRQTPIPKRTVPSQTRARSIAEASGSAIGTRGRVNDLPVREWLF